jgi:hypothetical protein
MCDDTEQVEHIFRITELKGEVERLSDGEIVVWESPDIPADVEEQFWEQVVAYESATMISYRERLSRDGIALPSPDEMTDAELTTALTDVIMALADHHIYLSSTDHLSNRELYTLLLVDTLSEEGPDIPATDVMVYHIDLVSSGSEEDVELWLRYYADDDARRHWVETWPEYSLPPHEQLPYDRDRTLPRLEE